MITGWVTDPYTGKGIRKVYVALQGSYATGLMGGTEYFDDLVLDSSDYSGRFHLKIPIHVIDSFIDKQGGPLSVYRFALEVRTTRNKEPFTLYNDYQVFSRFLPVDSIRFTDRNYLNRHTLLLTEKNERFKKDITGLSVPLYRGAGIQITAPADTDYIQKAALSVTIQELSRTTGKVVQQEELFFDRKGLEKKMLVKPRTPMNVILCKFYRGGTIRDTLAVLPRIELDPAGVCTYSLKERR